MIENLNKFSRYEEGLRVPKKVQQTPRTPLKVDSAVGLENHQFSQGWQWAGVTFGGFDRKEMARSQFCPRRLL